MKGDFAARGATETRNNPLVLKAYYLPVDRAKKSPGGVKQLTFVGGWATYLCGVARLVAGSVGIMEAAMPRIEVDPVCETAGAAS